MKIPEENVKWTSMTDVCLMAPWDMPEKMWIRQEPSDDRDTVLEFRVLLLPGIQKTIRTEITGYGGTPDKNNLWISLRLHYPPEEREKHRKMAGLIRGLAKTMGPEAMMEMKASEIASLHPGMAGLVKDALDVSIAKYKARN